ncbi:MAG: DMT family transporter [Rhodobacter sp.]|nr:DMT family transporter [Rhodobacter sp.]
MERKDRIDAFGAVSLIVFSALLGLNQVVIKLVNDGLQPVFSAGLRSLGALVLLYLWMRVFGSGARIEKGTFWGGLGAGTLFGLEFICLFVALDLTSVARASVIFYSMPVWLALMAHALIPGDRLTARKSFGLVLAFVGVAWAILDRSDGAEGSLAGDLLALAAAVCWAGIAIFARATPFQRVEPVMQLFWQVTVSAVLLLAVSPLFGPFIRDFQPLHAAGLAFQILVIATGAFLFWLWLLKIYPASGVASFSFLSPLFGVGFGWLILGETVGPGLWAALALVCLGLILINRAPRGRRPADASGRKGTHRGVS